MDCHTHLDIEHDDRPAELYEKVCEDVQAYFLLAGLDENSAVSNEKLISHVKKSRKTIGFAMVNPVQEPLSIDQLKALTLVNRLHGIVLYCSEHGFHPAHSEAMKLYAAAQELGLVVFFHNSSPLSPGAVLDYAQPYLLYEVAR